MKGLDNLKKRFDYRGGIAQEDRMTLDKLKTLKKALMYSYQAETIELMGEQLKCLINPDKETMDYDNKIISIPYEDIRPLVLQNKDPIDRPNYMIPNGVVFRNIENDTWWITYSQYLEETAYYRADVKRCNYQVQVGNNKYWIYVRGPVETTIPWNQKSNTSWNTPNYTLNVIMEKNKEIKDFFHRFQIVKFLDNNWEVKSVNPLGGDGVLEMTWQEWFNNEAEDAKIAEEAAANIPEIVPIDNKKPEIIGDRYILPYDSKWYYIKNTKNGTWSVDSDRIRILEQDEEKIAIQLLYGKSMKFNLIYDGDDYVKQLITVDSL